MKSSFTYLKLCFLKKYILKKGNVSIFFCLLNHTYSKARIESLVQHSIELTSDSIEALQYGVLRKLLLISYFFSTFKNSDLNLLFLINHYLEEAKEGIVNN